MNKWMEEIDTPEVEVIEENIFIDEELIKNKSLIRMDLNVIQYPLFSKNTKRKVNQIVKYYFNKNHDTYINVSPKAGDYIPGEMEEKMFIALMKIMKQKGMSEKFVVTAKELKDELKINSNTYIKKIKDSLSRLASTNYKFKNTMYSSKEKAILTDEIETTILSLRTLRLSQKENEELKNQIGDNRVKEVYEISISKPFYENIVRKGYLVYNSDILLGIENSTARTIYMLIEKLRFNNLYLKVDTLFLIKRIPLKFNSRNPSNTIKALENNFNELKEKKLIKSFNFIKESTWEKSEIEFFFYEESKIDKQERFYIDYNEFKKSLTTFTVSDTEHEDMQEKIEKITKEQVDELYSLLPNNAKKLKTMYKTVYDSAEKYGYKKVMSVIEYIKSQKKITKYRAYFLKALEENWDEDIILEDKVNNNENLVLNFEEKTEKEKDLSLSADYFEKLSLESKEKLEEKVFEKYLKDCGSADKESKHIKIAFKNAKHKLILKYIDENKLYDEKQEQLNIENANNKKENVITDIGVFNNYISESIEYYKVILNLSNDDVEKIRKEIAIELGRSFIKKELTLEMIDETIIRKIG